MLFYWKLNRNYTGHFISSRTLSDRKMVDDDQLIDSVKITEGLEQTDFTITVNLTRQLDLPDHAVLVYVDSSNRIFGPYDVVPVDDGHGPEKQMIRGVLDREFEDTVVNDFKTLFFDSSNTVAVDALFNYQPYKYWAELEPDYKQMITAKLQGVNTLAEVRSALKELDLTIRPETSLSGILVNGNVNIFTVSAVIDSLFPRQDDTIDDSNPLKLKQLLPQSYNKVNIPDVGAWTITKTTVPGFLELKETVDANYNYNYQTPDRLNRPGSAVNRLINIGERRFRHQYSRAWHGNERPARYLDSSAPIGAYAAVYIDSERWNLYNNSQTVKQIVNGKDLIILPNMVVNFEHDSDKYWRVRSVVHLYKRSHHLIEMDLVRWMGPYTKPITTPIPNPINLSWKYIENTREYELSWDQPYSVDYIDYWEIDFGDFKVTTEGISREELSLDPSKPQKVSYLIPVRRPDETLDLDAPSLVSVNSNYVSTVTPIGLYHDGSPTAPPILTTPTVNPLPPAVPQCSMNDCGTILVIEWDEVDKATAYIVDMSSATDTVFKVENLRTTSRKLEFTLWDGNGSQPSNYVKPSTNYQITVKSVDSAGVVTVTASPHDCPTEAYPTLSAPVIAVDYTNWNVEVYWDAVTNADRYRWNLTPETEDTIILTEGSTTDLAFDFPVWDRQSTRNATELDPNTSYTITVMAVNDCGVESVNSNTLTLDHNSYVYPLSAPNINTPTYDSNNQELTITWSAPDQGTPTQYSERWNKGETDRHPNLIWYGWITYSSNVVSATLSDIVSGDVVTFQLRGRNSDGLGAVGEITYTVP